MSYAELLRSPLWQRKRLEIFQRDSWRCQKCGREDMELQVHHLRYLPGHAPWEYDNLDLQTLCRVHHEEESGKRPTDHCLEVAYQAMALAHREGRWDDEYKWAEIGQKMIDEGHYYKGLV